MSRGTVTIGQCDRCGHREEFRIASTEHSWGLAWARQINAPARIGHTSPGAEPSPADLCPSCVISLMTWWAEPHNTKEKTVDQQA